MGWSDKYEYKVIHVHDMGSSYSLVEIFQDGVKVRPIAGSLVPSNKNPSEYARECVSELRGRGFARAFVGGIEKGNASGMQEMIERYLNSTLTTRPRFAGFEEVI
ncbi:hypothetical protein A6E01_20015 (plasmid) [Vibrio breoganii]|uniref:Uncharacterized protein n=1 Tax=Vibrio breoganii TaxID=553239 RepID=A0AAN0XZE6_9VIBR|nr:hypothetical protein [Vibrio breoganii]ANO35501.1 hypothetical protein A6E01_20015 [Vibrio breoganii]